MIWEIRCIGRFKKIQIALVGGPKNINSPIGVGGGWYIWKWDSPNMSMEAIFLKYLSYILLVVSLHYLSDTS